MGCDVGGWVEGLGTSAMARLPKQPMCCGVHLAAGCLYVVCVWVWYVCRVCWTGGTWLLRARACVTAVVQAAGLARLPAPLVLTANVSSGRDQSGG